MQIGIDIRPLMTRTRTGVGEYAYGLLSAIFSLDKQNDYWLFYNSRSDVGANIPRWEQDNVHYVGGHYPNWILNLGLALAHRPDIDQWISRAAGQSLDYFFSSNLNFTAVSAQAKFILTIHDLSFEFFSDCYSTQMRLWHRWLRPSAQVTRADVILTPSENTRQDVINYYGVEDSKVKVLYPGLSISRQVEKTEADAAVRHKYNLPERFILFLGTIEPRKNILGLLQAYCLLKTTGQIQTEALALVIAGATGWKDKEIRRSMAGTPGVRCLDYVEAMDKSSLYRLAEVFVYPSLYEGFGFPVIEAMACGTPVITSNRSSLPEITGDAACLVNPMNVSEIAAAINLLLKDNDLRAIYSARGLAQAEKFRWETTARQWLDLVTVR